MDSPRKNNDCYFYYYSTCLKGDGCLFRHEPSALGCETVCSFWRQGSCHNLNCNFRHMELRKNRKVIPCYWENQPGGCRKPHCSFQHKNPRVPVAVEMEKSNKEYDGVGAVKPLERSDWTRRTGVEAEGTSYEEHIASTGDADSSRLGPRRVSQGSEPAGYGSPPVDPLVVNFEEESDNESVPTTTPTKKPQKNVHVKTLEEIRLERIQAESAAFYGYERPNDLRSLISTRRMPSPKESDDFRILSLEEIRRNRQQKCGTRVSSWLQDSNGNPQSPAEANSDDVSCKQSHSPSIEMTMEHNCLHTDSSNKVTNGTSNVAEPNMKPRIIGRKFRKKPPEQSSSSVSSGVVKLKRQRLTENDDDSNKDYNSRLETCDQVMSEEFNGEPVNIDDVFLGSVEDNVVKSTSETLQVNAEVGDDDKLLEGSADEDILQDIDDLLKD